MVLLFVGYDELVDVVCFEYVVLLCECLGVEGFLSGLLMSYDDVLDEVFK